MYYHITPVGNVRKILKEGLVPQKTPMLTHEGDEGIRGVFLGIDEYECYDQVQWLPKGEVSGRWAVLEVDLPEYLEDRLKEDQYGYSYLTSKVPGKYIRQLKVVDLGRKLSKKEEEKKSKEDIEYVRKLRESARKEHPEWFEAKKNYEMRRNPNKTEPAIKSLLPLAIIGSLIWIFRKKI